MPSRIEDYALIGDCQTAALVARDGSIDWLCFPRFDSGACFAALLGTPENGRWLLAPAGTIRRIERRYLPGTLILETNYEIDDGAVTVVDFMPLRGDERGEESDLIRIVKGTRGQVRMTMELIVRFDYGWIVPWVRRTERGIRAIAGPDTLYCNTTVALEGQNLHTVADFVISEGQQIPLELIWTPTYHAEPQPTDPFDALQKTKEWWQSWSHRCSYRGEWQEAVERSFITLKALTYRPTGGLVAAPTTSLPEHIGGVRNWDYRFCWLRDATFTLYALMVGGYKDEAEAWREWLVNAVAGKPSEMQIMYAVDGQRRLAEQELDWLPGYENSVPVRVGNAAYRQHQLDVYGEVMDALHLARRVGLDPSENAWRIQRAILDFLESKWDQPDEGIWEIRGPRQHFTQSKAMAWVAMDRAVRGVEQFALDGPVEKWRALRDAIRQDVYQKGYHPELNSFVQYYGTEEVDASLLMLPLVGFIDATAPEMVGTVKRIQAQLMQDGFVHRYRTEVNTDGLPAGEGAFLLCTFWLADNLALQGRQAEARTVFERLLALRNDVGLLSEEYSVEGGRLVGNFPQAFSHIGLINTARNLTRAGGPAEDRQEQ